MLRVTTKDEHLDDEKNQKPRVLFKMTVEFWDDGEVVTDLIENVKGERGRPKAWRLNPKEFIESIKKQLSETPEFLVDEILKGIGINPIQYSSGLSLRKDKIESDIQNGEYGGT